MTTTRFHCPIHDCDWYHDRPEPPQPDALASVFGFGTVAATSAYQQSQATRLALRSHLVGHDLVEFVQTIADERTKAIQWLSSIAAHLSGEAWGPEQARRDAQEALAWFHAAMFGAYADPGSEREEADR